MLTLKQACVYSVTALAVGGAVYAGLSSKKSGSSLFRQEVTIPKRAAARSKPVISQTKSGEWTRTVTDESNNKERKNAPNPPVISPSYSSPAYAANVQAFNAIQRTMKSIEDINRINRLNQHIQQPIKAKIQ